MPELIGLESIREEFPLVTAAGAPIYLDNAATAHKPRAVLQAMTDFYLTANSNVGRGYHDLAFAADECYRKARQTVAEFIGADPDSVVFTPGTTAGINAVADHFVAPVLGEGDQVVITGMEHNSNLLPWRRLCEKRGADLVVVHTRADGSISLEAFREAVADDRVRFAALAHVSNVLGTLNPAGAMVAAAHEYGVPVLVDGAQAVPHQPVNVSDLGADFYAFSAHKAYGPQGIGVLYVRPELIADLSPFHVGGGTVKSVSFDEPVSYVPAPARLEGGTPNVAGAVGLAAACDFLTDVGMDRVAQHGAHLGRLAASMLNDHGPVQVVGGTDAGAQGIVSFAVEGVHPYDVGSHLNKAGIAMRCGVHCANTFLDELGLLGTVRLSFGAYNTEHEVTSVAAAVGSVAPGEWTRERPEVRF